MKRTLYVEEDLISRVNESYRIALIPSSLACNTVKVPGLELSADMTMQAE